MSGFRFVSRQLVKSLRRKKHAVIGSNRLQANGLHSVAQFMASVVLVELSAIQSKTNIYTMIASRMDLWQQLTESDEVRRQQVAFSCATGLPLTLLPANEGASAPLPAMFCVEGCMGKRSGSFCQGTLVDAEHKASRSGNPLQFRCPAGLTKVLVPVTVDGKHLGNLLAGPFCTGSLDAPRLRRLTGHLKQCGLESQVDGLRASWSGSPEMSPEKVRAVEALLEMFAHYLADYGKKLAAHESVPQSPLLRKLEPYLANADQQALTVRELAGRLHVSPCHFCRLFKKQTGVTFTHYRTQVRIETAKRLLLDPRRRITEAAYEAGFDSIPYFNRAFRRLVGCSPSEFRSGQIRP